MWDGSSDVCASELVILSEWRRQCGVLSLSSADPMRRRQPCRSPEDYTAIPSIPGRREDHSAANIEPRQHNHGEGSLPVESLRARQLRALHNDSEGRSGPIRESEPLTKRLGDGATYHATDRKSTRLNSCP